MGCVPHRSTQPELTATLPTLPTPQPSFVLPTAVASIEGASKASGALADLDVLIGQEALAAAHTRSLSYPIKQGLVRGPRRN